MPDQERIDDLEWCVSCLMLDANGDVGDLGELGDLDPDDRGNHLYNWPGDDAEHNPNTRHAALMEAQWPSADWELTNNCPEECEGSFSWTPCYGCGVSLGGDRHPFVAWRKDKA